MAEPKIVKSTCGMCFAACGVLIQVEDGRITAVKGDPDSPVNYGVLCPKGQAAVELLYHPERLTHPLKQIGKKGRGQWTRISWDEALDTIADKLAGIRDAYGPEQVAFIQGSAKGLIDNYNERLANAFGTPNFSTTGHICFLPRLFASKMTCGSYTVPDYESGPACIVVWGANLVETRIGEHFRTVRQLKGGTELIVVDPVQTLLAKKARTWLQLRPGTDLALALAMIHVIIDQKLYDRNFVEHFIVGFNRLKDHVRKYPPATVSQITWLAPEKIEEAARFYARSKPACIQWGNAVDHGVNSFQTARAISILRAITGNLDVIGGDLLPSYPLAGQGASDITLRHRIEPQVWEKRIGAEQNQLPLFRRVLPKSLINAIIDENPYPVRCLYVHASNPLMTYTNAGRTYQALKKLDFLAVSDFFLTPTAALADIVLPAATFLEYDSVVAPPYYPFAQVQQKVVQIGECRSDFEITRGLASRLGLQDLFWKNSNDLLDEVLKPTGLTFNEFKNKGVVAGATAYRKYEKSGFETPSGKVELYSNQLQSWGFDPLPIYREPPDSPLSEPDLAQTYPLILTTKKSIYYLHSCGRQIKSLRQGHPEPVIYLHPDTAAENSIADGDWVYIETQRGRVKQKAFLSESLHPQVVCADFGWWFPEDGNCELHGWKDANINLLFDDQSLDSPETGSLNLRGLLCRVYKVDND
jgi:anaerobic selenocysteine-containing dehydrogenase